MMNFHFYCLLLPFIFHYSVHCSLSSQDKSITTRNVQGEMNNNLSSTLLQEQPALKVKDRASKSSKQKTPSFLLDENNRIDDLQDEGVESAMIDPLQDQVVSEASKKFKALMGQGRYNEIAEIGRNMNNYEFLDQLCPVMKDLDHYRNLHACLKSHGMLANFLVKGDSELVNRVIAEPKLADSEYYVSDKVLVDAVPVAFYEENYDRVIDLFVSMEERGAEVGKQSGMRNAMPHFEWFMVRVFSAIDYVENNAQIKDFLTLRCDELKRKHSKILEAFCQELVRRLKHRLDNLTARNMLIDLVGQTSLLTSTAFIKGFLDNADDNDRFSFIKYGWRVAIRESLKLEYNGEGECLWRVMIEELLDSIFWCLSIHR